LWWAELPEFGDELGKAIGEAAEAVVRRLGREGAAEHFEEVLCGEERVDDPRQSGAECSAGCFQPLAATPDYS